jgi:hypothetical protein
MSLLLGLAAAVEDEGAVVDAAVEVVPDAGFGIL